MKDGVGSSHKEVMIPLLHAAYRNDRACIKAIQSLFAEPSLLDEFLMFVDKIGCKSSHYLIHKALIYRPENSTSIYPILKKYSDFGSKPNFILIAPPDMLEVPTIKSTTGICLEASFFTNLTKEVMKNVYTSNMFEGLINLEDITYYYKQFCDGRKDTPSRVAGLIILFRMDRNLLNDCIINLELEKTYKAYEIIQCSRKTKVSEHSDLMEKILLIVSRLLAPK